MDANGVGAMPVGEAWDGSSANGVACAGGGGVRGARCGRAACVVGGVTAADAEVGGCRGICCRGVYCVS